MFLVIQLQEDLHEKQKQELKMKEDFESLKGNLRSEKKYLSDIVSERDNLRTICDEKDRALQVIIFKKELQPILIGVCNLSLLIVCRLYYWTNRTLR